MIDVGAIRAEARAVPGDAVGISKAQLDQLLDAVERAQSAEQLLAARPPARRSRVSRGHRAHRDAANPAE